MQNNKQKIRQFILFFARADVFFYSVAWLMVVLTVGTIAQRYLGLYEAQNRFFSSFYFWVGEIPVPGGYPVLGLIFVGLLARLVFASPWVRSKIGVNVVHIGVLALLFGGFLTAAFSDEGSMYLEEGATSSFVTDYHRSELAFVDTRAANQDKVTAFQYGWLRAGEKLSHANLPFQVEVEKYFRNTEPRQRTSPANGSEHGFAKNFELVEKELESENERNRAGIVIKVSGLGNAQDGIYALFEGMPIAQPIEVRGGKFSVELRHARKPLPFSIELKKFERQMHPGTEVARSYASDVILRDGSLKQAARVQMNEPLRYKGYTFYQASFSEEGAKRASVLAVVHNLGRVFPYISSIVMCLGLLLHILLQLPILFRNTKENEGVKL